MELIQILLALILREMPDKPAATERAKPAPLPRDKEPGFWAQVFPKPVQEFRQTPFGLVPIAGNRPSINYSRSPF